MPPRLARVGDFNATVTAHRAIPRALALVRADIGAAIEWRWSGTRDQ